MPRILIASAEFSPFVRTGGLGDAVAGLAAALSADHEVTVALPGYRGLEGPALGDGWAELATGGVRVLAFTHPSFDRDGIYGPRPGESFDDNWERYGRFALAVGALSPAFDLVHLHDAHTGAAALLSRKPTIFTIHNAAHPVLGPLPETIALLGLGVETGYPGGLLEWYGSANYLKAGIAAADSVTTVSAGHARELAVDETAFGLGGLIRSLDHPIVGIMNGIDDAAWDPARDPALPAPFSAGSPAGRKRSRAALMKQTDLDDGTVFLNVGRMARQKGLHLLDPSLDELVIEGFRLVLVGNGELDTMVDEWAERHPGAVAHLPYTEDLARLTFAGGDACLMPSRFEPCGLGQMYAMRYGAPPVARLTGGLADSVIDIDEDPTDGNGFGFRSFTAESLAKTVRRAMRYRAGFPKLWERVQANGMRGDWSWTARAGEYTALYTEVLHR